MATVLVAKAALSISVWSRANMAETIEDLPLQLRREIGHFFEVYKDLDPDRHSEVRGWGDVEEAWDRIAWARENFALRI